MVIFKAPKKKSSMKEIEKLTKCKFMNGQAMLIATLKANIKKRKPKSIRNLLPLNKTLIVEQ